METCVRASRLGGHDTREWKECVGGEGSCGARRQFNEPVIMVSTVPCTLMLEGQLPTHACMTVGEEPGSQVKRPWSMSTAGKEIVGPGYSVRHETDEARDESRKM
jgi:hypothetical protein